MVVLILSLHHISISFTPIHSRVMPFEQSVDLAVEVQEFPSAPVFMPHSSFRHHLYVYPLSVDLSKTAYRNISCRVELLDREVPDTESLRFLTPKSINSQALSYVRARAPQPPRAYRSCTDVTPLPRCRPPATRPCRTMTRPHSSTRRYLTNSWSFSYLLAPP